MFGYIRYIYAFYPKKYQYSPSARLFEPDYFTFLVCISDFKDLDLTKRTIPRFLTKNIYMQYVWQKLVIHICYIYKSV